MFRFFAVQKESERVSGRGGKEGGKKGFRREREREGERRTRRSENFVQSAFSRKLNNSHLDSIEINADSLSVSFSLLCTLPHTHPHARTHSPSLSHSHTRSLSLSLSFSSLVVEDRSAKFWHELYGPDSSVTSLAEAVAAAWLLYPRPVYSGRVETMQGEGGSQLGSYPGSVSNGNPFEEAPH